MSDADRLLGLVEDAIVAHGGDLGGWTKHEEHTLQLFDGRVTLRAELRDYDPTRESVVHAHILSALHEHDDEVLDACLMGAGDDRDKALAQAAGPIRSFMDNQPVCMTCQAGVIGGDRAQGFVEGDFGLGGLRAFVGPAMYRGFDGEHIATQIDDKKPWFRYAAESAAPRTVHLAKSTIAPNGHKGWRRELEVDGHEISHSDPDWPGGVAPPKAGYVTRFAVFEFPRNSKEILRRAELERTVTHFAEHLSKYDSANRLMEEMVEQGFDADLVHEAESIATIAFGRTLFEPLGVVYPPTIIRARRDGRVETDVPLMSLPAYARARAMAPRLYQTLSNEDYQRLCFYNAESNAILQAVEAAGDKTVFGKMKMFPLVVPDRGVSQQTMDDAIAVLKSWVRKPAAEKKPWWKFW
jgi:hypothetical protein